MLLKVLPWLTLYALGCHSLSIQSPSNKVVAPSIRPNIHKEIGRVHETNNQQFNSLSSIRICSTKQDDLQTIVDLLAVESTPPQKDSQKPRLFGNWNVSIQKLKSEASLTSQLTHRHAAIEHASKLLSRCEQQYDKDRHFSMEEKRYVLWGDDTFRSKLEKAAKTTSTWEGTIWDEWNFALTPDQSMLHHFMLSAVDDDFVGSGDDQSPGVVGFCEVGICDIPELDSGVIDVNSHAEEQRYIPCIGNLVVSPNHRRRGIGEKLVQSAIRLLKAYYFNPQSDSYLGLYVEKDNLPAIRLYERLGFAISGTCSPHSENSSRIFMLMNVHTSSPVVNRVPVFNGYMQ